MHTNHRMRADAQPSISPSTPIGSFLESPELALAFKFATANRRRLIVTLAGASLAVSLIIYQLFLIVGFVSSASSLLRSIDADLWLTAHEAQAFDFSATMRRDHAYAVAGFEGVADTAPVVSGFATVIDSRGIPSVVSIAGLPMARFRLVSDEPATRVVKHPETERYAFIDRTSFSKFAVRETPFALEISGQQVQVSSTMEGYPTFLGSPFLVTAEANARRWLRLPDDVCTGVGVWLKPGANAETTRAALAQAYPELSVLTTAQYARRSAIFWLTGTGAGGGLLLSAVMAFGIGLLIISQNLYASVLEALQHYTTLRAIGFEERTLGRIVLTQSIAIALSAGVLGSVLAYGYAALTKAFVLGWIATPWYVPVAVLIACAFIGVAASISAIRLIHSLEPAHALRQ